MKINKIYHGNNIEILKTFEDNSIDSIVTDPPYGISFMNKKWDYDVPTVEFWREALRVLKHGGHALVACGTRTQHRMAVNLEDAGFEIRDIVAWVYGSGFPKSLNIGLAIDKINGVESKVVSSGRSGKSSHAFQSEETTTAGGYEIKEAQNRWQGWGTALKPAMELWTLCRKPLQGTVAQNVLKHGVGGINIDGCRVATDDDLARINGIDGGMFGVGNNNNNKAQQMKERGEKYAGRFPANFIHDGSDEVVELFPNTSPTKPHDGDGGKLDTQDMGWGFKRMPSTLADNGGSASRFFYTAKASQTERNWGLDGFEEDVTTDGRTKPIDNAFNRGETKRKNIHPTVKPIDLMRYLVRLVTPRGGLCLDPFMGSGTTAVACKMEGFNYVGCELMEEYVKIAEARIEGVVVYDSNIDTKVAIQESQKEKKEQELGIMNIFDFLGDE